jgi:hypothetical protein
MQQLKTNYLYLGAESNLSDHSSDYLSIYLLCIYAVIISGYVLSVEPLRVWL